MSRPSTLRRRVLRWGLIVVAALLVGEIVARRYISGSLDIVHPSADPRLVYELKPGRYLSDGYFLRSDVVEYVVDARGCRRGPEAEPAGAPVYFLGSSIVFGIAVDAESALPQAARRALRDHHPPIDIAPQNCSVPGYSLLQTLRHAELALDRDGVRSLVIVVGPKHGSVPYDWSRVAPASPSLRWLTARSRLARLAHLLRVVKQANGFRLPPAPPAELRAALDRFTGAVQRTGARVVVFVVGQLEHPDFDLPAELRSRDLVTVPITQPPHDPTHVHSDGDHWSPEGVRYIVHQMEPALAALVEAPPVPPAQDPTR